MYCAENTPPISVPPEAHFDEHDRAEELLESMPVYVYEEDVAKEASRLRGAVEPCGVDGLVSALISALGSAPS